MDLCNMPLSQLPTGEGGSIVCINPGLKSYRRLMDLGFIPGARVIALHRGYGGEPVACLVKGAVMALRGEDADNILIKPEGECTHGV